MVKLLSVNVGLPRDIEWHGKTVRTAVWKGPVRGRRTVRKLNVDGDGQGDLHGHGGEHRAVYVYQIDSYRYWEKQLHRSDFVYGQFGENLTVDGLSDDEVCIERSGPHERPVVLLSAGVGATPVLAMLHALAKEPSPPKVWWLYGARDSTEHPFANESRDVLRAIPDSRGFVVYSRPRPQDQQGRDFDTSGRIGVALLDQLGVPRDADFYLCGPASFLHDLTAALVAWGVPPQRVHTEVFGPGGSTTPGVVGAPVRAPHPPAASAPGPGPSVSFARSGLTVRWDPACRSLLELAEACDVPVRWACRTGVCHTCETGIVSGHVTYLPEPLDPPAEGNALTCCSQPAGDVDLDL